MQRLTICLVIALLGLAAPQRAAAEATNRFDTVDAVEIDSRRTSFVITLVVTGIVHGGTAPVTMSFRFNTTSNPSGFEQAAHCQRLAVLAMSRPGKYEFAIGGGGTETSSGCKLTLRTP